uniref:Uncharacterized protein n=2 Tax=Anguilla anguilla TaxID=7936 RepID=A0A0E9SL04_ANGAN
MNQYGIKLSNVYTLLLRRARKALFKALHSCRVIHLKYKFKFY